MEATSLKRIKHGFTEIVNREMGLSSSKSFSRHFSASEVLVEKINLYGELNGHEGCVNTVVFNSTGDLLVSGSDDKHVMVWNWATKCKILSYASGHLDNIFQARVMPFTDDKRIVTSSADGQVRLGEISENGQVRTRRLGKHQGRVHNLAVEPGSPHIFYSCGEDGLVQHFDLRSSSATKLFQCFSYSNREPLNLRLNAIVFDPRNSNYFAIGGSDEYARVYDIRRCQLDASNISDTPVNIFCPRQLVNFKHVHITGLTYSNTSELLVSYNDELIYLFQKNMGLGPSPLSLQSEALQRLEEPQVYVGHRNSRTVKGVSFFGPKDEYVMSGSDCGHIFIWKKKGAKLVRLMVGDGHIVNHLEPHPYMPSFATCGIDKNVKLWAPMVSDAPALPKNLEKIMESNRQNREDQSRVSLTPDVIMHVLRLQRRQMFGYVERRYNRADLDSDEEDGGEDYFSGLSNDNVSSEEDPADSSGECKIS
ncbi:DDB1- and CUL4-associated factor 8 [Durio zibethinus]|uniref:DDB1- and CUL4-associated factor 8 n=1 Tax=Durio zibethinus TaxID=66656 RepID=A0A6P5XPT7_DURZI|nr:DDB1- and CUL4-associated factor 8 [Durio zibethinus]XP_022730335.1 DDB1- and CUL4-associated factor 8 [Durio zibethinus]